MSVLHDLKNDQISYQPGHQNNPDQWATLGDYVRGLYAVPDEKGRMTRGRLAGMDERIKRARQDLRAAKRAYAAKGLKLPESNAAKAAHKGVFAEFNQLNLAKPPDYDFAGRLGVYAR